MIQIPVLHRRSTAVFVLWGQGLQAPKLVPYRQRLWAQPQPLPEA